MRRRLLSRAAVPAALLALLVLAAARGTAGAQVADTGEYLRRMDSDGDGLVSLDEYLAWMGYAFEQRDRDHDGVLQGDELPGGRGRPVTLTQHRATLTARFRRQDADGDGYLSARELMAPPR